MRGLGACSSPDFVGTVQIQEVVREKMWKEGNDIFLIFTALSSPCMTAVPRPATGCQISFINDLASFSVPVLSLQYKCPSAPPSVVLEMRAPGASQLFRRQVRALALAASEAVHQRVLCSSPSVQKRLLVTTSVRA